MSSGRWIVMGDDGLDGARIVGVMTAASMAIVMALLVAMGFLTGVVLAWLS